MIVSLIVAMDENRGIGIDNRLPWHISDDLKRFKALTMGHHLIMGRKTYESIGEQLPGRTMIVISRNDSYHTQGGLVVHSLQGALKLAEARGEDEVFIIGGSDIFAQSITIVDRIYLTQVHTSTLADVYFPNFDEEDWIEIEIDRHDADAKNQYPFTFKSLVRNW